MAIAKTASRNVALKVAKMRDSIMEDQDELIIRKSECEELGLEANTKAVTIYAHKFTITCNKKNYMLFKKKY